MIDLKVPKSMSPYGLVPTLERFKEAITYLYSKKYLKNLFTADDTQASIQAALDNDGYAYLLPGNYTLTETLVLPRRYGCALIGLGGSIAYVKSAPIHPGLISGGTVTLNWAGPSDVPMIRVLGAEYRLDGLCLVGSDQTQIGVLVENGQRADYAVRGGKGYIPSIIGANLDCVMQFGLWKNGDNADVTSVGRLTAYDCNAAVRVLGGLSFELHFDYVRNARCPITFDCQDGGGLHCGGGQILATGGTLLKLGVVNPTASTYVIRGWHVDEPAAQKGYKLVECTDRSWATVNIQAHLPQNEAVGPIAHLIGPVSLKLENCANLYPESIVGVDHNAGTPVVIADGCRLKGAWTDKNLLVGDGTSIMQNCFNNKGGILTL